MSTSAPEKKRLGVQILTPEGSVHDGVAAMVIAPSVGGELGILPRHVPLIVQLRAGETRLKLLDETEVVMATTAGYMSVEDDRVLIMVEQAELPLRPPPAMRWPHVVPRPTSSAPRTA